MAKAWGYMLMVVQESPTSSRSLLPYDVSDADERQRRGQVVKALLNDWEADDSGYEDESWPQLKAAMDKERHAIGARTLFSGE
jgi:hypothetical protein